MRAVGVFGGTFDPVHNAHLRVADEVRQQLEIKDFRLVPAADPPHRDYTHANAHHRLAMLRLALQDFPGLRLDTRELDRDGPSWMVETLGSLRRENPESPLILVVGQDSANSFDSWHRWRDILELAHLVIVNRPGREEIYSPELQAELQSRRSADATSLHNSMAGLVYHLKVSSHDLSSTQVRQLLRSGLAVETQLPRPVADYIRDHELYG